MLSWILASPRIHTARWHVVSGAVVVVVGGLGVAKQGWGKELSKEAEQGGEGA